MIVVVRLQVTFQVTSVFTRICSFPLSFFLSSVFFNIKTPPSVQKGLYKWLKDRLNYQRSSVRTERGEGTRHFKLGLLGFKAFHKHLFGLKSAQ